MDNSQHCSFSVADRSYLAILKKDVHAFALRIGFTDTQLAEIDIIVAEITSNLIKHAKEGELLVKQVIHHNVVGIEIIGLDNGPGIKEINAMMKDGTSTKGTLGHGLGSIQRLSDTFQLYSLPNWGSIILARKYLGTLPARAKEKVEVRSINVPKPNETVSGDGIYSYLTPEYYKVISLDGLGHGPDAHAAVMKAIDEFKNCPFNDAVEVIKYIHPLIKRTRGAVGSLAIFSFKEKKWSLCGIGNIATRIHTGFSLKSYMPYNGIIGLTIPGTMKENIVPHSACLHLFMASDGVRTKWDLSKYPGIFKYDLSISAAAIYKDFARKTDDMSIVISKVNV